MVDFSIVLYRIKWTSTRENRTTLKSKKRNKRNISFTSSQRNLIWPLKCLTKLWWVLVYVRYLTPSVSFFSCAFWLWSWVRKSQDERFLHTIRVRKMSTKGKIQPNVGQKRGRDGGGGEGYTSLQAVTASITSFVKVFPTPDDPMRTVGLIA